MKCDKCRKEIRMEAIMVDFGIYHPTCTSMRPLRGKIADAMEKDIFIPLKNNIISIINNRGKVTV
ncbi:hypothetical protein KKA03_04830 [archaeon]|nr:hypothetical protein [archaeon]